MKAAVDGRLVDFDGAAVSALAHNAMCLSAGRRMTMTSIHKVRVFRGSDDQWYYESKSANGQVLSTSEGYTRKEDAVHGLTAEFEGQAYNVEIEEEFIPKEADNG